LEELLAFGNILRVLTSKLEYLFGVELKLDLIASQALTPASKGKCQLFLSILLPAFGIAFYRLAVRDGFAYGVNKAHAAFAIDPDLCLAWSVNLTVSRWMTRLLASVLAIFEGFSASRATPDLHQLLFPP
jgi:hypothetical protein